MTLEIKPEMLLALPIIAGLVQLAKRLMPALKRHTRAVLGLTAGLGLAAGLMLTEGDWRQRTVQGLILALGSCGLYDVGKVNLKRRQP